MKFFKPTNKLKELLLLQHIEMNPDTTQKEIAKIIDGAPSMVNVYINKLEDANYLKREYKSAKIVYYRITEEGKRMKDQLQNDYDKELLELYQLCRKNL
ncbi:MarR family winged helix-turn-helix transcriptional regulator [Anaerosalibacter sp. Marseille-P3206]|uniref:MarR family winged helix-turn-helix transcriptional regulator n=1 Tax=Anaerosalibacter sp. Marseille-P3206 TaxID=1871005 RepID=UPI0009858CBC|nr:MarR family winged helix-turn-helix transcriptional regulator [Anaerosalibacter sp. Marseille-P3206]